jgi:hypothetical protein
MELRVEKSVGYKPAKVKKDEEKGVNDENLYKVYVYNDKIDSLEEFRYKGRNYYLYSSENIANNTIIETKFDTNTQTFTVYRYRYDKNRPNAIQTAIDTFRDMIQPFLLKKIIDYLDGKIELEPEEEFKEEEYETKYKKDLQKYDYSSSEEEDVSVDEDDSEVEFDFSKR